MQSDIVETMKNTIGALVILVTLLVGILIGILIAPRIETNVYAQQTPPAAAPSPPAVPVCIDSADTECLSPIMTVGSAGIGKLLTNQISTDHLSVNGYDILKLQENTLTAMIRGGLITQDAAKALVESSHPDKYLRYQPPQPRPTPPTTAPKP
jgi:hypothetical protein